MSEELARFAIDLRADLNESGAYDVPPLTVSDDDDEVVLTVTTLAGPTYELVAREPGAVPQAGDLDQVAALRFAANILRTLSAAEPSVIIEDKYRVAARALDKLAETDGLTPAEAAYVAGEGGDPDAVAEIVRGVSPAWPLGAVLPGHWEPAPDCTVIHPYGAEGWRPGAGDTHEHWVPGRALAWHKGRHRWQEHDGYPRHQHSLNGALTISPHGTRAHFRGDSFQERER